jgi:hypothetical protein
MEMSRGATMDGSMAEDRGNDALAQGGGNATTAGVRFQAGLGALLAVRMLAETPLDDLLGLANSRIRSLRFETNAPVDDILIETDQGGFVAIQAKTNVTMSDALNSVLGSVADQFARYWIVTSSGAVNEDWARPLDPTRDRVILAFGPASSSPIRELGGALEPGMRQTPAAGHRERFRRLLGQAFEAQGWSVEDAPIDQLLACVRFLACDPEGMDQKLALEQLRPILANGTQAAVAFPAIADACGDQMRWRGGFDAPMLRAELVKRGVGLAAPPTYRQSIAALSTYSKTVTSALEAYETIALAKGRRVSIERDCLREVIAAARGGHLLLTGEPGAGKSGILNGLARHLARDAPVVMLAVDRLPVSSVGELSAELGLDRPFLDVLANWPGEGPCYLVVDALDASRGGQADAVFRAVMAGVLGLPGDRWRVLASIRSFDLRLGRQFRELFAGTPPLDALADPAFLMVRHVAVPEWSDHEFALILSQYDGLAEAIAGGGRALATLSRVPFNTRLLAELLSTGVPPSSFAGTASQTQLLSRYWEVRVETHGAAAAVCLRLVVERMLGAQSLRAPRLDIAAVVPDALAALERDAVLVPQNGDREIVFRHHILFDYAASRVLLDPSDPQGLAERVAGVAALALAPALAFVLTEAWEGSAMHSDFWRNALALAGDRGGDPVAGSVVARLGAELPRAAPDLVPLTAELVPPANPDRAIHVLRAVLGALAVRNEDRREIVAAPWLAVASDLSGQLERIGSAASGSLRQLLHILLGRVALSGPERVVAGSLSRALLAHYVAAHPDFTPVAILFVCKTYDTNIPASRDALRILLDADRLATHAAIDMPAVAGEIGTIARVDPAFAAEIVATIFQFNVTDESKTRLGDSQIMALTSTARQDYSLARYSITEAFPEYIARQPVDAARALVAAIEGHVPSETAIPDVETLHFTVSGRAYEFVPDRSFIWAWNIDDPHGSDAEKLLQAAVARLRDAPPEDARVLACALLDHARYGIIWSRLFHAASRRPDVLGDLVWDLLLEGPFFDQHETAKDAIDAALAIHALRDDAERERLELTWLAKDVSQAMEPAAARTLFLRRTLGALRAPAAAQAAQAWLAESDEHGQPMANDRPFSISVGRSSGRPWDDDPPDDPDSPVGQLRTAIAALDSAFGLSGDSPAIDDAAALLDAVEHYRADAVADTLEDEQQAEASVPVVKALNALLANGGHALDRVPDGAARVERLIGWLTGLGLPAATPDIETRFEDFPTWGIPAPRVDAADLVYDLLSVAPSRSGQALALLDRLLADPHPAVRLNASQRLVALWRFDRDQMWNRVEQVVATERNRGVLRYFVPHVLGRLFAEAERMEPLILALWAQYGSQREDEKARDLVRHLASIISALWIWQARPDSHAIIEAALRDDIRQSGAMLDDVGRTARDALILGYEDDGDPVVRERGQALVGAILRRAADGLEDQIGREDDRREQDVIDAQLMLLDHVVSQLRFGGIGSKRREEEPGLQGTDASRRFLHDMEPLLRRAGDVAHPRSLHHLVELLDHLSPGDPKLAFSLIAHGVLHSGRLFGYQSETMGADLVVQIVARMLADHREMFADAGIRAQLIEMLELFTGYGWPSARRLLYELPDLFR